MNQSTSRPIGVYYEWVMARYVGDQAKHVMGLAQQGIGYHILEQPDKGSAWVVVAFRRPTGPLPDHLTKIQDERLIKKLEKRGGK